MKLFITLRHKSKKGMNIEYIREIPEQKIADFILELRDSDPSLHGRESRISLTDIGIDLLHHYQNIEGVQHYLGE